MGVCKIMTNSTSNETREIEDEMEKKHMTSYDMDMIWHDMTSTHDKQRDTEHNIWNLPKIGDGPRNIHPFSKTKQNNAWDDDMGKNSIHDDTTLHTWMVFLNLWILMLPIHLIVIRW